MKKIYLTLAIGLLTLPILAQEEAADTTRVKLGNTTILIIENANGGMEVTDEDGNPVEVDDSKDSNDKCEKRKTSDAHWAGVDFGFGLMMNDEFQTNFDNNPYWENDPASSNVWNINIMEHKFNFGTPYVGLTTGLGFNFTSLAFKNNYVVSSSPDSIFAFVDSVNIYSKNKLKASYLTIPLLLEFNTSADDDRSFYLAAGVVAGVKLTSKIKREGEVNGDKFKQKERGAYNLNPFKLDAAVRMGYGSFGVFANYSLTSLFENDKTVAVYPLTFGVSLNF
ncbi:MAG: PorT family protein [Crocinitomicaceae bacterium]|nr:PorT family protein [Crocinitomicaceae bacterium]